MTQRPGSYAVLRLPTYRRYLAAAIAYSVGMWTFQTVLIWVVLEETGSASAVSLLLISLTVPWLLCSLPAGILADRYDLKRLMLIGQAVAALSMFGAAAATIGGVMSLAVGMAAIFVVGIFDAFYNVPAMVFVGRLVEPRLMAGAIGLSALQYGCGRIVGGVLTGVAIAAIGAGATIAVAATLLAVSALLIQTLPSLPRLETSPGRASLGDLATAIRWFGGSPSGLALVGLGLSAAVFVYSYFTLLPIVATEVLGRRIRRTRAAHDRRRPGRVHRGAAHRYRRTPDRARACRRPGAPARVRGVRRRRPVPGAPADVCASRRA